MKNPKTHVPKEVRRYLSRIGKKGGQIGGAKSSPAKTAAARKAVEIRWKRHFERLSLQGDEAQ